MMDTAPLIGPSFGPAAGGAPDSVVILCHGFGSNGHDLISLAPHWAEILPGTLFLAPNAPEPCAQAPGGYQWFDIDLDNPSPEKRFAGAERSAHVLNNFIDEMLARHNVAADHLVLVGFSQGTMMSLHVGLRRVPAPAGIVGYSGRLAGGDGALVGIVSKPPIYLFHGGADTMIPPADMEATRDALEVAGLAVRTHVSPGLGHSIDEFGLTAGGAFIQEVLGGAG